jgi:membrane dipeptidase
MNDRVERLTIALAVIAGLSVASGAQDDRVARIHDRFVFADMHSHPSRFHRAGVTRIEPDEIARYQKSLMDVMVANISTDAIYSGRFVQPDGTEVPAREYRPKPGEPYAFTLERFAKIQKTISDGEAVLAASPAAVMEARRAGKLAIMPALEGADGLESSLENLRKLHAMRLGLLQLVHFRANELGHIQTYPYSPGGLNPFGRDAVREANRLGIIVDLAHANTETIMDALEVSTTPMLFSHTGIVTLDHCDRCLTDAEIDAIAAKEGVIGIWPNGEQNKTMADMVRHIDYVKRRVGIDHVGIGSDLRGMSEYTEGFGEEANFRAIAEGLIAAGYTDDEVGKVMGGNFMRVWQRVLEVAARPSDR